MPEQRLKGQEILLTIVKNGELQTLIDSIKESEVTYNITTLQEGYIGETGDRFDEIFNGMSFTLSGHMTNAQIVDLAEAVRQRAQRRAGSSIRIDLAMTLIFPNGDLRTIAVPNVFFGDIPLSNGGREEYTSFSLDCKASSPDVF